MSPRTRALTLGGLWAPLVVAAILIPALLLRDRLPDPLATHWSSGGRPDSSMSLPVSLLFAIGIFLVLWAVSMGVAVHGQVFDRRLSRGYWWAVLAWSGLFAAGMELSTVLANLDAPAWTQARSPVWAAVTVLLVSVLGAVAAGFAFRGAPDQPVPDGEAPPALRLRAGERSVWVSRVLNPWLALLAALPAVVALVLLVLWFIGVLPSATLWASLAGTLIVFVAGILTYTVSVRVSPAGVAVGFGPFGWPVRRIPLAKIETAWAEDRFPSQVGGWGIRGVPGMAAIMIRGGDCLVLRYRSGGQLIISTDDARNGASLINALIAETPTP
ncbi:DUF1648 domain-containing protein [Nonomuraea sp. NPDC050310]|uniref:DUF1648 domain-containing protein n=1 Tax=Nonomuraea sp. NPDC050310 TaxID=3154935 RepID=UPI0033DCD94B